MLVIVGTLVTVTGLITHGMGVEAPSLFDDRSGQILAGAGPSGLGFTMLIAWLPMRPAGS